MAVAGRNDDNPVGAPGTIDRGCGGILEDIDRGYVIGAYRADVPAYKAVDHIQGRVVAVDRIFTADPDLHAGPRCPVGCLDKHACRTSFDRVRKPDNGLFIEI